MPRGSEGLRAEVTLVAAAPGAGHEGLSRGQAASAGSVRPALTREVPLRKAAGSFAPLLLFALWQ